MSFQRRKILRALAARGYRIVREGAAHTIVGDGAGRTAPVPRHRQINRITARKIASELEIDPEEFFREVR